MTLPMTLQEMKDKAEAIHSSQSSWKTSQDGSYEMALSHAGYYDLCAKIKAFENAR